MKKLVLLLLLISFNLFANKIEYTSNLNSITLKDKSQKNNRPDWSRLAKQTASVGVLVVTATGIIYALPESVSHWDRKNALPLDKWKKNVRSGPVWDHDGHLINWLGHSYAGAIYYIAARNSNFGQFGSFVYSAAMSTFVWEYGIESFAEIPSIQDLIITPVIGSILGEFLYTQEKHILKNSGKVWNSKFLGTTSLVLIDPIGSISNIIGFKDKTVQGWWSVGNASYNQGSKSDVVVGLQFNYKY